MRDPRKNSLRAAALVALAASAAAANSTISLAIATGQYGMRKEIPHSLGVELELRAPWRLGPLRPIAGFLTSAGRGVFLYSGLAWEVDLPLGLQITPSFAPAVALDGADLDLGFPLEFRSSLELSIATGDQIRLGVAFSHISNARLGVRNPGVEVLVLGLAVSSR